MNGICDPHLTSSVKDAVIVELPSMPSLRGLVTSVENGRGVIPFDIRRVYYLYDLPASAERGGHSHRQEQRLIIAVSGCFDVTIDDGVETRTITLRHPSQGLYIPPGIWRTVHSFSAGAVALALCSTLFDEDDYVRDYDTFKTLTSPKLTAR